MAVDANSALEQAKAQMAQLEKGEEVKVLQGQIDALKADNERLRAENKEYMEMNQKLFLKVANPVESSPAEQVDPLVKSALEKIEIYNKGVDANGSNN